MCHYIFLERGVNSNQFSNIEKEKRQEETLRPLGDLVHQFWFLTTRTNCLTFIGEHESRQSLSLCLCRPMAVMDNPANGGSGKAAVSRTVVGIPSIDMAEALSQANVIVRGQEQQILPLFEYKQEDGVSSVVLIHSQEWLELPLD